MWKHVEHTCEPGIVDTTSSSFVVYIRKNIRFVESTDEEIPSHWECDEITIPKEVYGIIEEHNAVLVDIEEALVELASIIAQN